MDKMVKYFSGKHVFITGHTGFKGAWLCRVLVGCGAVVTGYALPPGVDEPLYALANVEKDMHSIYGDVRDFQSLKTAVANAKPDYIFHLAAQALVINGYESPRETYETNVMGTANLLEAVREGVERPCSVLNVTTDKVYENHEWEKGYRENDTLNGHDPYSNSKSCSELVTGCYAKLFEPERGIQISTARAGNVIGGGDFSANRIIPDCVRAAAKKESIAVRNPNSVRPYQHVLDPLMAYLYIAHAQTEDPAKSGCYNIGPNDDCCVTTAELVTEFCRHWGEGLAWVSPNRAGKGFREAGILKLDCSKAKKVLGWHPVWGIEEGVRYTVEWYKEFLSRGAVDVLMDEQLACFYKDMAKEEESIREHLSKM